MTAMANVLVTLDAQRSQTDLTTPAAAITPQRDLVQAATPPIEPLPTRDIRSNSEIQKAINLQLRRLRD